MLLKDNTFIDIVTQYHLTLSGLYHTSFFASVELKHSLDNAENRVGIYSGSGYKGPLTATQLAGPDPFASDGSHVFYGAERISAENLSRFISEIYGKLQGQVLCEAFEATEAFLKSLAEELYRDSPSLMKRVTEFQAKHNLSPGTPEFYRRYLKWSCGHSCKSLLRILRDEIPQFSTLIDQAGRYMAPIGALQIAETCRHTITHVFGVVETETLRIAD